MIRFICIVIVLFLYLVIGIPVLLIENVVGLFLSPDGAVDVPAHAENCRSERNCDRRRKHPG